MIILEQETD